MLDYSKEEKTGIRGDPEQSPILPGANLVDLVTDDSWCRGASLCHCGSKGSR